MKTNDIAFLVIALFFTHLSYAQTTFTSVANGNWDDGATWGNTSPGVIGIDFPDRDDVVIINGHDVTVNAVDDNSAAGVSPQGLNQENVCGCTASCNGGMPGCGTTSFYHNARVNINTGGTLNITGVTPIFGDTVNIYGTGSLTTSGDIFVLSALSTEASSTLSIGDDFVISGDGVVNLLNGTTGADDLYLDGPNASICGDGSIDIGDDLRSFNSDGNIADQVCTNFTIDCGDGDCCNSGDCGDLATDGSDDGNISPGSGGATGDPDVVLPIELAYFETHIDGNEVVISWGTYAEINNDFFTVQRSTDHINWEDIKKTDGQGNSNILHNYTYRDAKPIKGTSYYKVKQTDFDGKFSYTPIAIVNIGSESFTLSPNPNTGVFSIYAASPISPESIKIFDLAGNTISHSILPDDAGLKISLNEVESGLYMVSIRQPSGMIMEKLIVR